MELPKGSTVKYYEKENVEITEKMLKEINDDFVGYLRIFGKNGTDTEDNYLIIKEGEITAAESEINGSETRWGEESLSFVKGREYDHAAIEFVEYDDFRYEMALEINEECRIDGKAKSTPSTRKKRRKKVKKRTTGKMDREELLKKYRIKDPTDDTVVELIGERNEKIVEFENRMKSKLLNGAKTFLYAETLFMEVAFTGFEMFLRNEILNGNINLFAKCIVHEKNIEKVREKLDNGIKNIVKENLKKEVGERYKINITLHNKLRIRDAERSNVKEFSIKSTL